MEAIGQLAGGVAHDFNNLLTVSLGYGEIRLETLRRTIRDGRRGRSRKAGQSAASLTRQLLAFSRKQILEPVVLDLNAVLATGPHVGRLIGEDIELISARSCAGSVKADGGTRADCRDLAVNARDAMPTAARHIATATWSWTSICPNPPGRRFRPAYRPRGQ